MYSLCTYLCFKLHYLNQKQYVNMFYLHDILFKNVKYIPYNDFTIQPENSVDTTWSGANGFCLNGKNEICIVWEEEKDEWNLPGGGKEKNETPRETFIREVQEETQCEPVDIHYFHAVYAKKYDDTMQEKKDTPIDYSFRFVCRLENIQEFIPRKDGTEIDGRKFVPLDELPHYIPWLESAENGKESFEKLKEYLKLNLKQLRN